MTRPPTNCFMAIMKSDCRLQCPLQKDFSEGSLTLLSSGFYSTCTILYWSGLRKDFLKGVQLEEMLNHLNYFELSNNQWFKGQECPKIFCLKTVEYRDLTFLYKFIGYKKYSPILHVSLWFIDTKNPTCYPKSVKKNSSDCQFSINELYLLRSLLSKIKKKINFWQNLFWTVP